MHTVTVTNGDLEYFRSIVSAGLRGEFGSITELRIDVHDSGQLQFSTGSYASGHFGTPSAPLVSAGESGVEAINRAIEEAERQDFNPDASHEGSGNPYRNVTDEDPANVLPRLDRLERFASRVASDYGLHLPELLTADGKDYQTP